MVRDLLVALTLLMLSSTASQRLATYTQLSSKTADGNVRTAMNDSFKVG